MWQSAWREEFQRATARGGAPAVRAFLEASGEECFADVLEVAERLESFDEVHDRETDS